ncbi:MAG TPA: DNA polymerase III subunit gamma/tau [Candidatus Azoamicus sp. OHIO2]
MSDILYNKWRPKLLEDIVGQDDVIYVIKNILRNKYIHNSFMISGSHGVGKTTLARILTKCINCETGITEKPCNKCYCCVSIDNFDNPDSVEVDAASNTKMDDIKIILSSSIYQPFRNRFKTYIIDECHMLSVNSFNFLLKILEDDKINNIYIFVTTNLKKVPDTIVSRCLNLELKKIEKKYLKERISLILKCENYIFQDDILNRLMIFSDGSLRTIINIIEKIGYKRNITADDLNNILGLAPIECVLSIMKSICDKNFNTMLNESTFLINKTVNINNVITQFQLLLYQMILLKFGIKYDTNLDCTFLFKYVLKNLDTKKIQLLYECLLKAKILISLSPSVEIGFNMIVITMFVKFHDIS